MLELRFINASGNAVDLIGNDYFNLVGVDGMTKFSASLSSTVVGGIDGDTVNNVQGQPRSIILYLRIKQGVNVERAKRYILQYIKAKQQGALVWVQNERSTTISGIVEDIEMPRWSEACTMQITLHCERPYWEDVDDVVQRISEAISLHYFTDDPYNMLYFPVDGIPFGEYNTLRQQNFYNAGDVSTGLEITIHALGTVTNPIIYDTYGNYFGVGYGEDTKQLVLETGDYVTITTGKGNKTVTLNGSVSLFNKIKAGSTWLQLQAGSNDFSIDSDDESTQNMYFSLVYKQLYV